MRKSKEKTKEPKEHKAAIKRGQSDACIDSAEREQARPKHKKPWQETYATVKEIEDFLRDRTMLRFNTVTHRVECHEPTEFNTDVPGGWEPITNRELMSQWRAMSFEKRVREADMKNLIDSDFVPKYNPFEFYLKRLPPWNEDKGDYIMELSLSVNVKGDGEEQMLFYEYLKKWLVAMVASWVDPLVVNNVILVLIGPQGIYKTTWFNFLLPPELRQFFYTKTNAEFRNKDDLLVLSQYGLLCCEELDTMKPPDMNRLKAAVTMPYIDVRAPFERYPEHRPHIASFCGTGNNVQFLTDSTGNRRWLPFEVESIESPWQNPLNYEGIYSQAYRLYRDGFRFYFSQEEVNRLNRHNEQFEAVNLERELIDTYFRIPQDYEYGEVMPVSRALQIAGGNLTSELRKDKMRMAFAELGFRYKHTNAARGFIVMQRSPQEIKERQRMLATDGDTVTPVTPK